MKILLRLSPKRRIILLIVTLLFIFGILLLSELFLREEHLSDVGPKILEVIIPKIKDWNVIVPHNPIFPHAIRFR